MLEATNFTIQAGIFARNATIRGITAFCDIRGIRLTYTEERHLFSSKFHIVVSGNASDITDLIFAIADIQNGK